MKHFETILIRFTKRDYQNGEIVINLNEHLWVHEEQEEWRRSHRRFLPFITLKSPTGMAKDFIYAGMSGADLIYKNEKDGHVAILGFRETPTGSLGADGIAMTMGIEAVI
jgi:hypothetical protein